MNRIVALLRKSSRRNAYEELLQLDDRLLSDIGLTRSDVGLIAQGKRLATTRVGFGV